MTIRTVGEVVANLQRFPPHFIVKMWDSDQMVHRDPEIRFMDGWTRPQDYEEIKEPTVEIGT